MLDTHETQSVGPKYQQLKAYVLQQIGNGEWPPAHQLPSEHDLVKQLKVSRMTVNRALRELASEGVLTRVQGVGTFVAELKGRSHLIEIRNIADEVRERHHDYMARVISNDSAAIGKRLAARMQLTPTDMVFHSLIVHHENRVPIQVEDRYVNSRLVPDYGKVNFEQTTPSEYLLKVAPLQEVEHTVRAEMPNAKIRKLLKLNTDEPCLVLYRRTWSQGRIASFASLYHPGNHYELSDHFTPRSD